MIAVIVPIYFVIITSQRISVLLLLYMYVLFQWLSKLVTLCIDEQTRASQ